MSVVRYLSRCAAWLAGGLVLVSALLVGVDVLMRNLFGLSALYSFELSRYLFGAVVTFGLSFALVERAHIRIDPLVRLLPAGARAVADVVALAATAPVALVMAWQGIDLVHQSLRLGAISNSPLGIPIAIPQGMWAFGLIWFAVTSVVLLVVASGALAKAQFDRVNALAGLPAMGGEGTEVKDLAHKPARAEA
ncbi:MAG: hypothetical protein CTY25_05035 [Methylobacterium sp.]|nr:MAG: hypothetical protein CTY25_05035 [Methylobacterium sp.]